MKDIQDFNQKWMNPWCRGIMLALLELLEREDKERQELQNQGGLVENEAQAPGLQETEGQYEADGQYEDGQYEIETGQEGMEPGLEAGGETALPEMEMGYGEDGQQENDLAA